MFWVHASNTARFAQSLRDVVDFVRVPGRKDPTADILELAYTWLRDERKGKWLVILDNVDDASFLVKAPTDLFKDDQKHSTGSRNGRPLKEYLPQCQHGRILVTSRNKSAAQQLVERSDAIPVSPMDDMHALALFEKKLAIPHNDRDASAELVRALEYMPLAIVQAAAYIAQRNPRYSVSRYLEDFQRTDHEKTRLLNYMDGHLRRDQEAKNSIIITWQTSFEHIREIRPSAADLLSLMSFFDRQGIPEALLRRREDNFTDVYSGKSE